MPGRQRENKRIGQQPCADAFGEDVAEQEVAVAVHDKDGGSGGRQAGQRIDDFPVERFVRVVDAIVAGPGFEQVAENIDRLGVACRAGEVIQKAPGCARRLRRQMQVGEEIDHVR